ncbi:helix-turn-helix domain-containing protein [Nocardia farcinica]|uniref:helix-turn-helix domain-containing protein n=1 Tax=Nocardia farcinica TaxID=37329 RepID=UPI0009D5B328|nr:helix-turn-helix domain-containing protein [Nocardia farcinica]MBF6538160.1 helix-turn-helix domain-containing protein [Nocardia farcinica]SLG33901.1 RNA polymerase sigma factor, sigma-70 family [Mycobacteroides abscessus subsp. abscessus]
MARKHTLSPEQRAGTQERRNRALELRLAGTPQADIAEQMGVSRTTVSKWISHAIRDITRENAEEYIEIQQQRFDAMLAGIWNDATHGDTWKIDRALAIEDQRAKLLGLYKHAELKVVADAKGNVSEESKSMVGQLVEALHTAYTLDKNAENSDEDDGGDE